MASHAGGGDFSEEEHHRRYTNAHSGKHPIPTIKGYREHRKELDDQLNETEEAQQGPEDESKTKRAYDSAKAILKGEDEPGSQHDPYPSTNRNNANRPSMNDGSTSRRHDGPPTPPEDDHAPQHAPHHDHAEAPSSKKDDKKKNKEGKSATETVASTYDPKAKRKAMKKTKRSGGGREVTDPVTHLPIVIHDQTDKDLDNAPENEPEPGQNHRTATGLSGASKNDGDLDWERNHAQQVHNGMQKTFPPPQSERVKGELVAVYQMALFAALGATSILIMLAMLVLRGPSAHWPGWTITGTALRLLAVGGFGLLAVGAVLTVGQWLSSKTQEIFDDEVWDAARREERDTVGDDSELPESTQWLNSFLSSVWPLINPDLFSSLVDMIEDVMQASLPKAIKMVSVDDMGQGSEAIRILGVRWLPTGAASQSVDSDGQLQTPDDKDRKTSGDRTDPDNGTQQGGGDEADNSVAVSKDDEQSQQQAQDQVDEKEGMEAEEGDFVNMELAFSYRSRSSGKSIRSKAKNAHLYLKFYLPGGIAIPVWVELRGLIAKARLRMQLTPDPPFVQLCTITFLGQPRASLSCVPLSKHNLNLMNVPLISSFVQSAIDAALAEYVAPKSLTLNLKDMLMGEDFKKNTIAKGVIWIYIKRARGFKEGDGGIGPMKGSSDGYVTVSWSKFGKPVATTRVIVDEQAPDWHEYASILVTPEEIDAEEKLRIQLWDSDKWTADDDLGRVELDLKDLMHNNETRNRIHDREDRFTGENSEEKMAGSLTWSVGYFSKTRITDKQLKQQKFNDKIHTKLELKEHISKTAEHKLREAGKTADDDEVQQQKAQDYKELEDSMIISTPPMPEYPSGILSIQIHNITGLAMQKLNKKDKEHHDDMQDEEGEDKDDLPDSYCTIVLNHTKVYRTRTKPKNSKPFYNAGTERFVKDWRDCEVMVSVRNSREREDDPLLGLVYLPLRHVFKDRSQVMENYPLVGGMGYGRARISMVWRSVELKLPAELKGWDVGTLEVRAPIRALGDLDGAMQNRIKIRTNIGKAKLYPVSGEENSSAKSGLWQIKAKKKHRGREAEDEQSVFLAVRRRYASAVILEFRESRLGPDSTPAFAILWLQELPDEEDKKMTLKVWKGGKENLERAEACCGYNGSSKGDVEVDDVEKDSEQQVLGEVEVTLRFWRGLSGYHKNYAAKSKNNDLRDVMQCLDTINDEGLVDDGDDDSSDSDSSDSDDDGPFDADEKHRKKKLAVHTNDDDSINSGTDTDGEGKNKLIHAGRSGLSDFKKGVKQIPRAPLEGVSTAVTGLVGGGGHNDSDDGSRGLRGQVRDYKDHQKSLHRKHRGVMQWRAAREANHLGGKLGRLKGHVSRLFEHGERQPGVETEV